MLKHSLLFAVILFLTISSNGQTTVDSTAIKINYGSSDKEFLEYLQFMGVDKYSISVNDTSLKDKIVHIRLREFINGKVTRTEDFVEQEKYSKMLYGFAKKDTSYEFRVWTRKFTTDSIEIYFRFYRHGVTKKFKIQSSNSYSLRNPITPSSKVYKTPKNSFSPFLVYSLPYEDPSSPGFYKYCALTADGVTPEKWGEVYKVPHYILLEIKFD